MKTTKCNIAAGVIAFLIVYLALAFFAVDMNENYAFANPMVLFLAIIAGIIIFGVSGLCCGCCKADCKENEKTAKKKKGAK